jgi:long-chain acyl-CoA synthetase
LIEHPAVADCVVVGAPHELLGEVPHAIVQTASGSEPSADLTRELLRFLGERVAAMKLPRRIEYRATLPRDPNGKLRRRELPTELAP